VQQRLDKPFFDLRAGLVTEAGPLNTPDGATVDEQNFHLLIDGSRRRRRGMRLEEGGAPIGLPIGVPDTSPEPILLNITVLNVESLEDSFGDQQMLFQLGGPSGIEEDLDSNPPFALTPPSFGDLYSDWDGIEPLLPEETWYPDVWLGIGITSDTDTWNILVLLEGDQEPDSWSVEVTGDLTNEGGAGSLGAGTWHGRSGIGYEVSVGLNLDGDYDSVFAGTVTVTATVGSQTYVSTTTIWYKGVVF